MADDDISIGNKIKQNINDIYDFVAKKEKQIAEIGKQLSDGAKRLSKEKIELLESEIKTLEKHKTEALEQVGVYGNLQKAVESYATDSRSLMDSFSSSFGRMGNVVGEFTAKLTDGFMEVANRAGLLGATLSDGVREFVNPLSNANTNVKIFGTTISNVNSAVSNLLKTQITAREATLLFGGSFESSAKAILEAEDAASKYAANLRTSAASTGIQKTELDAMNKVIMQVPDSLKYVSEAFLGMSGSIERNILPAAALGTTMRALGFSTSEAAQKGRESWFAFNQGIGETIKQLGNMAAAAKETGIDRRTVTEEIMRTSESLAIFGRKSGEAANTWATFMSSMTQSGVPINAAKSMVDDFVKSISRMSTEHRAFISMASGLSQGRTALGGALQMELMLRQEGGLDKNIEALTSTLTKFTGGSIITLEQAANNPQLEMQFQVQREMLGKLGVSTDKEQQNRILEVLRGVQSGGISQLEGSKELSGIAEEGKSIQEKQLTSLEKIVQNTQAMIGGSFDKQLMAADRAMRPNDLNAGINELTSAMVRSGSGAAQMERTNVLDAFGASVGNITKGVVRNFNDYLENVGGKTDLAAIGERIQESFKIALKDEKPGLRERAAREPGQQKAVGVVPDVVKPGEQTYVEYINDKATGMVPLVSERNVRSTTDSDIINSLVGNKNGQQEVLPNTQQLMKEQKGASSEDLKVLLNDLQKLMKEQKGASNEDLKVLLNDLQKQQNQLAPRGIGQNEILIKVQTSVEDVVDKVKTMFKETFGNVEANIANNMLGKHS